MVFSRSLSACVASGALLAVCLAAPSAPAAPSAGASAAPVERTLRDARITESSGLAVSRRFAGVLYTHNDSGDEPRVFAVGRAGKTRAVIRLAGATALDWEDIAGGPRETVWLGDIGDNAAARSEIQVYRFREPRKLTSRGVPWTRFRLAYPDGAHDAEALLVHPRTGRLFVVTKESSGASIYRAPRRLRSGALNRLARVGPAPAVVTGGDFTMSGHRLVLRTYGEAFVYKRPGSRPRVLALPSQPQGESVTFGPAAKALLIGSEGSASHVIRVPL